MLGVLVKFMVMLMILAIITAVIITLAVPVILFGLMKLKFIRPLVLPALTLFVLHTVRMPVGGLVLAVVLILNFVLSKLVMYVVLKFVQPMVITLPSR